MSDCIGTGCKADSLMERIAALEAERADIIKINNGWAQEWDAMREERDGMLAVLKAAKAMRERTRFERVGALHDSAEAFDAALAALEKGQE